MKHFLVIFALIAAAYAGIESYHGGILSGTGYQAPSFHAPWASSVDTGIRRFGSTAGVIAAPAYYGAAIGGYGHEHHYY